MIVIRPESLIYGGHFETENYNQQIKELETKIEAQNFWNDRRKSEEIITELNRLKAISEKIQTLKDEVDTFLYFFKNADDDDLSYLLDTDYITVGKELDELENQILLNGEYDKGDAVLEIHSGAGGTEACDWADMLYRMYIRWAESKKYKIEIIDRQDGLEVGIKSLTMIIKGPYAYGYLKHEKGVHRLVRISPFDSNSRRHTSFASVEVSPAIDDEVNVDIDEKDLRIDVYRSTGAGGQGVNTTDSAVRITHLPTKIVVTCQNERSQLQNKDKCMQILKSKLLQLELEKKQEEISQLKGSKQDINFGSQIRSYIMHPYSMVKDHRTNTETSNVSKVLDGDIDIFINDNLKGK